MPIFEYTCGRCGCEFELLLASGSSKASCPECASSRVKKRFSVFAVAGSSRESRASGASGSSCSSCRSRHCSTCN